MIRLPELGLELPERPWREYDVTGILERPEGAAPPMPVAFEPVVDAVHTATLSRWELRIRAQSAGMALTSAELVLPEACGARWSVEPVPVTAEDVLAGR